MGIKMRKKDKRQKDRKTERQKDNPKQVSPMNRDRLIVSRFSD